VGGALHGANVNSPAGRFRIFEFVVHGASAESHSSALRIPIQQFSRVRRIAVLEFAGPMSGLPGMFRVRRNQKTGFCLQEN